MDRSWPDYAGHPIRITAERQEHIFRQEEMRGQEARIKETLAAPDVVFQSRSDDEVRLYHRLYTETLVGTKYLCAVVKWRSDDRFLMTAYFTSKPKAGQVLWTRTTR